MADEQLQVFVDALRERAALIRAWQAFELGGPVPPALDYLGTAGLLERVADALARQGEKP